MRCLSVAISLINHNLPCCIRLLSTFILSTLHDFPIFSVCSYGIFTFLRYLFLFLCLRRDRSDCPSFCKFVILWFASCILPVDRNAFFMFCGMIFFTGLFELIRPEVYYAQFCFLELFTFKCHRKWSTNYTYSITEKNLYGLT